jgi:hypothetical protein
MPIERDRIKELLNPVSAQMHQRCRNIRIERDRIKEFVHLVSAQMHTALQNKMYFKRRLFPLSDVVFSYI